MVFEKGKGHGGTVSRASDHAEVAILRVLQKKKKASVLESLFR